jgi:hypothetical protein
MTNISKLKYGITFMGITAISAAAFVFRSSLFPSAAAKVARSGHEIGKLENGQFLIEDLDRADISPAKILIIKDRDASLFVYYLPIENGKIPMPERWCGHTSFGVFCSDFRPQLVLNKIKKLVILHVTTLL